MPSIESISIVWSQCQWELRTRKQFGPRLEAHVNNYNRFEDAVSAVAMLMDEPGTWLAVDEARVRATLGSALPEGLPGWVRTDDDGFYIKINEQGEVVPPCTDPRCEGGVLVIGEYVARDGTVDIHTQPCAECARVNDN